MTSQELKLLNEMKENCIKQANYADSKAMEKYNLLRSLEDKILKLEDADLKVKITIDYVKDCLEHLCTVDEIEILRKLGYNIDTEK